MAKYTAEQIEILKKRGQPVDLLTMTEAQRLKAMAALDREFEAYRKANEELAALTGERDDKGLELARSLIAHAKSGGPQVSTKELADYLQTKEAWDGEPKGVA